MKPVETVSKRFSKIGDRVGGGPGPHYPWNVHNLVLQIPVSRIYILRTYTRDICTHTHTYAWGKKHFHTHTSRDRPRADMNKS